MGHRIRKTLLGKLEVQFLCRACAQAIICPLDDAGTEQPCPTCGAMQPCPGERELNQIREDGRRSQEEATRRYEEMEERKALEQRVKAEQEAARRLRASMKPEALFETEQQAIRTADWSDRLMWRAFRTLRQLFAAQIAFAIGLMVLSGVALLVAVTVAAAQATQRYPNYGFAVTMAALGVSGILSGYVLYLTTALAATIVYVERNTRGSLRP